MIVLFTDFGAPGPYTGQVEAVLHRHVPGERVITLFADLPPQNVPAAACLLPPYSTCLPAGTVFFCVVDPGVGSFEDVPVVLRVDGRWYVGPHNGQFDLLARRGTRVDCWSIEASPDTLSATFHGRDLYAPACARIAAGGGPDGEIMTWRERLALPDDLYEIVYVDHFGNAMTGIRASQLHADAALAIGGTEIRYARTFSAVDPGRVFWYANSNGLVEIAANRSSAAEILGLRAGSTVTAG